MHVEDIIFHMFQYIQKLRTEGPQEWVFEECKVETSPSFSHMCFHHSCMHMKQLCALPLCRI